MLAIVCYMYLGQGKIGREWELGWGSTRQNREREREISQSHARKWKGVTKLQWNVNYLMTGVFINSW
jgi:hypothetical protein